MSETTFFSCHDCCHKEKAKNPIWSRCGHPAVDAIELEGYGIETYTADDRVKLDHLVNDVLRLRLVNAGEKKIIPNFEFPFQYEAVWIASCKGYDRHGKKELKMWKSGQN